MKTIIEEINQNNGSFFRKTIVDDKQQVLYKKDVRFYIKTAVCNNFEFIVLYDDEMNIIEPVYNYLNVSIRNKSVNTRNLYASIIKKFYIFAALQEKEVNKFEFDDFIKFQCFLLGYNAGLVSEYLYTYSGTSKQVTEKYLNVCKDFLKKSHFKNYQLIATIGVSNGGKNINLNHDCPKFITFAQMKQFIDYISGDKSLSYIEKLEYKAIYSLMEYGGLRIGEVLGLTIQDLDQKSKAELPNHKIITIRNRTSDTSIQSAKTCMNVFDRKDYNSTEYWIKGIGYQTALIPNETYDLVMDYYESISYALKRKGFECVKADDVYARGENTYIFHNKNKNTILNTKLLREYTRDMFEHFDIPVDKMKRSNNLLHRFRHGYIMYLLYEKHYNPAMVIKYSRHTSTRSLEPYNNPTDEQLAAILNSVDE